MIWFLVWVTIERKWSEEENERRVKRRKGYWSWDERDVCRCERGIVFLSSTWGTGLEMY